jgi:hypothetical protein
MIFDSDFDLLTNLLGVLHQVTKGIDSRKGRIQFTLIVQVNGFIVYLLFLEMKLTSIQHTD